jgi:hypothetical protein
MMKWTGKDCIKWQGACVQHKQLVYSRRTKVLISWVLQCINAKEDITGMGGIDAPGKDNEQVERKEDTGVMYILSFKSNNDTVHCLFKESNPRLNIRIERIQKVMPYLIK